MEDRSQCDATNTKFGFTLLSRKLKLKLDLDAQGASGLKSFIAAYIASGINRKCDILDAIADITGSHSESLADLLLMEGENIDWRISKDGTFALPL